MDEILKPILTNPTFSPRARQLCVLFFVVFTIALIFWTWRDADRRGAMPWFWALVVAVLQRRRLARLPGRPPAGVRRRRARARARDPREGGRARRRRGGVCAACLKPVETDFLICPYCMKKLKKPCVDCGRALKMNWSSARTARRSRSELRRRARDLTVKLPDGSTSPSPKARPSATSPPRSARGSRRPPSSASSTASWSTSTRVVRDGETRRDRHGVAARGARHPAPLGRARHGRGREGPLPDGEVRHRPRDRGRLLLRLRRRPPVHARGPRRDRGRACARSPPRSCRSSAASSTGSRRSTRSRASRTSRSSSPSCPRTRRSRSTRRATSPTSAAARTSPTPARSRRSSS